MDDGYSSVVATVAGWPCRGVRRSKGHHDRWGMSSLGTRRGAPKGQNRCDNVDCRVVASAIMTKREQDDRMALVSTDASVMTQRARSRQY